MKNKKDILVASSNLSPEVDFTKVLNEIANYKGSSQEKQTFIIFSMLGMDIRKLKPKEKGLLLKIVQKSKHFWKNKWQKTLRDPFGLYKVFYYTLPVCLAVYL